MRLEPTHVNHVVPIFNHVFKEFHGSIWVYNTTFQNQKLQGRNCELDNDMVY